VVALREKLARSREQNATLSSPEASETAAHLAAIGSFTDLMAEQRGDLELSSSKELTEEANIFTAQKAAALKELSDLREEIEIVWNRTPVQHEYELASVFMHRGMLYLLADVSFLLKWIDRGSNLWSLLLTSKSTAIYARSMAEVQ